MAGASPHWKQIETPNAHLGLRRPGIGAVFTDLLQRQGGIAQFEPAPEEFALWCPLLGHFEAEAVDIEPD
jgi:hypothetical protein